MYSKFPLSHEREIVKKKINKGREEPQENREIVEDETRS